MSNIIFFGPPGAGKGTQAKIISNNLNVPHLSTGDILRKKLLDKDSLADELNKIMSSGNLVSDDILNSIVASQLKNVLKNGFTLDGHPRTLKQSEFLNNFLNFKNLEEVVLMGNSLGGHVALLYTKFYPEKVKGLIITGSSGLYENAMGDGYPKRGDYEYIKAKSEEVFYDPKIATKEIVDEVFESVNDRNKLLRTLAIAKSAIRHNMAKDLPNMHTRTAIIWGAQDSVTPPNVADEFNSLLPNSDLYWIDKCGHAPMMEHPDRFNEIMHSWLEKYNI